MTQLQPQSAIPLKVVFVHLGREHLGIEYLSAVLKQEGFAVELVFDPGLFSQEDNVFCSPFLEKIFKQKDIVGQVLRTKAELIAFSVYSTNYPWAVSIAEELKKQCVTPIVFGGIHATLVPERVIQSPAVDIVHVGEGEQSFVQLARAIRDGQGLSDVQNIYYKEDGQVLKNNIKPFCDDLDSLPFPDKALFAPHVNLRDDYMIMTSRGCPFQCTYCCESYLSTLEAGEHFRRRSVSSVIDELVVMKGRYHYREVMFFDSIFFTDKPWLKELLAQYQEYIAVPFRCLGHPQFFDEEVACLLKAAGCYGINFGVQTFNEQLRKEVLRRPETNDRIQKVFAACDAAQLRYDVDLMFGLPGATAADYELPLGFLKDCKYLNRVKCYSLSYFPKLSIIERARQEQLIDDQDVADIESGCVGDFFHSASMSSPEMAQQERLFKKLYKIFGLLPLKSRRAVAEKRNYQWIRYIPGPFIVFLQLINGMIKKDYRFYVYVSKYCDAFRQKVFSSERKANDETLL